MKSLLKRIMKKVQTFSKMRDAYKFVPPGHFYSPIPSIDDVRQSEKNIFIIPDNIPGIELNEEKQLLMFNELVSFYGEMPFKKNKTADMRYFFENEFFSYSDAIILYAMIRHLKPKKIIEAGSGHSSCVLLDTNELFFGNSIQCTFIEPFPELFLSLLKEGDSERIHLIAKGIQDTDNSEFMSLSAGDILLIDSSHVSKINSDVNHIFFRILSNIKSGVYIHFHDIFYPFEYPREWIYEGRAWNESYLLHAFLQYNKDFEIIYFNSFMGHFHEDRIMKGMPLCMKNKGGSIWLRKK